jgi:hypothetical protein
MVELGGVTVPADRLAPAASGIDDELQAAIDRMHDELGSEPLPRLGWRVLRDDGDSVVVGAYEDNVWHGWSTITMHREGGRWRAGASSFGQHPRPTAATRGHGFSLAFSRPRFTCRKGDLPNVTVTLTNGSGNWFRDTTSWCALGHLIEVRTGRALPTEETMALAAAGRELNLDPGESAEFPVVLFTRGLAALDVGEYAIEATFADLDLRASSGQLVVE